MLYTKYKHFLSHWYKHIQRNIKKLILIIHMVSIYILELMNNKYYVGSTARIEVSMDDVNYHIPWIQKYKPIRILHVIYDCDKYDEDKYTRKYMDDYGLDNVRGGSFSTEHLDPVIRAMLNPTCSIYNNMDSCASEAKNTIDGCKSIFLRIQNNYH